MKLKFIGAAHLTEYHGLADFLTDEEKEVSDEVGEILLNRFPGLFELVEEEATTASDEANDEAAGEADKPSRQAEAVVRQWEEGAPENYYSDTTFERREKILSVLSSHQDGLQLLEIAGELSLPYQQLTRAAKTLLDDGLIEKRGNVYKLASSGDYYEIELEEEAEIEVLDESE